MLKSILNMIKDFVIEPAGTISLILFIVGVFIFLIYKYNLKKSIIKSFISAIFTFLAFAIFMVLTIKLNNPKFNYLIYPMILNIWYFSLKGVKHRMIISNIMVIVAFLSEFYIIEKIFFE